MLAVSTPVAITVSISAVVILLAALAFLRVLLRREPSPPRWRRYRVGFFAEREPDDDRDAP